MGRRCTVAKHFFILTYLDMIVCIANLCIFCIGFVSEMYLHWWEDNGRIYGLFVYGSVSISLAITLVSTIMKCYTKRMAVPLSYMWIVMTCILAVYPPDWFCLPFMAIGGVIVHEVFIVAHIWHFYTVILGENIPFYLSLALVVLVWDLRHLKDNWYRSIPLLVGHTMCFCYILIQLLAQIALNTYFFHCMVYLGAIILSIGIHELYDQAVREAEKEDKVNVSL